MPQTPSSPLAVIVDDDVRYEMYVPDADKDFIQKFLQTEGKPYEQEMLRDMAYRLAPGDLVLDVGAHIGNHTFYLANAASATVEAFEPNKKLAAAIQATAERGGLQDRIRVHDVGVGRESSRARFREELPDNLGAQELETGKGDIPVVSLDSLTFEKPVRIVKIDVEGMELEVLEGAAALIDRDRPLLYVECRDEQSFRQLSRWSAANQYAWLESFNATPTHLLCPAEIVDISERLGRLASREVVHEYRYNSRLRRAQRRQQAAERRAADAEAALAQLKETHADVLNASASLKNSLLVRQKKMGDVLGKNSELLARHQALEAELKGLEQERVQAERAYRGRIKVLRSARDTAEARIREIEESTTHQLGEVIASAATSLRGFFGLPVSLVRLLVRGFQRSRVRRSRRAEYAESLDALVEAPDDFTPYLLDWIKKSPRSRDAVAILYADINVNIVDGSSIWLSSMASILCAKVPCILISKAQVERDLILSNVQNSQNLIVLEPTVVPGLKKLNIDASARLIKALDDLLPKVNVLVIRGLDVADALLSDRQFHGRSAAYLTDFFTIDDGRRITNSSQQSKLTTCATRAGKILAQTRQIADEISKLTERQFDVVHLPPVIPDQLPKVDLRTAANDSPIRIGYAGKVNSRWGILELLSWAEQLTEEGVQIELHIVADKITNGPDPGYENLKKVIKAKMSEIGARHYTGFNRESAMNLMAKMDFVWCFRPALLEDNTLEFSTKLAEMVAVEARCICYPNEINKQALGSDYPYFVRDFDGFSELLQQHDWGNVPEKTASRIRERHGLAHVIDRVQSELISADPSKAPEHTRNVVFSGHDFKFIDAYVSSLKSRNVPVARDCWQWSAVQNQDALMRLHEAADVIFCEWGLANAVWHSKHLKPGQRLIIRIHAQEVRERARRFGAAINVEKVEKFIFVSEEIRETALKMWDWPVEKTLIVPNYVLDKEFVLREKTASSPLVLGMVGIVPRLKRFDRALDLLELLLERGIDATLKIKGHRPETLEFMNAPGRRPELEYYQKQYKRISESKTIKGRVHFDPWGHDIALWYDAVDVILSCSETESFHYALADGVLSGCLPVVWPWSGAGRTFDESWVVNNAREAAERITSSMKLSVEQRTLIAKKNRALITERYGSEKIFSMLDEQILG